MKRGKKKELTIWHLKDLFSVQAISFLRTGISLASWCLWPSSLPDSRSSGWTTYAIILRGFFNNQWSEVLRLIHYNFKILVTDLQDMNIIWLWWLSQPHWGRKAYFPHVFCKRKETGAERVHDKLSKLQIRFTHKNEELTILTDLIFYERE